MWAAEARNPVGEAIARIMAEGRYDENYDEGPEFHYGIVAAIRARTSDEALRALVDTFAVLEEVKRRLLEEAIEAARRRLDQGVLVKPVDKPVTG
jgi:DNA-binding FadR family transcriptional regulator